LVPKLRLGTPLPKLCFDWGQRAKSSRFSRSRASRSAFPGRAWERDGLGTRWLSRQDFLELTTSRLADVPRNGISGKAAAQFASQVPSGLLGDLEMRGPRDAVKLVQVIRNTPKIDQRFGQTRLRIDRVVDAAKQHCLIQHVDSGAHQFAQGVGARSDQL